MNHIRIIGGLFRGKKLSVPDVEGLRPTPDRVRETLFNWLMNDIKNARCLDAFAGSGALGFEAFSRGASKIVLLEQASKAYVNLQKIMTQFNSPKLSLVKTDSRAYLQQCVEQFDIIFLDPPFAFNYIPQCLNEIVSRKLLPSGGLVYTESATEISIDSTQWQQVKLKQTGQVVYGLLEKL